MLLVLAVAAAVYFTALASYPLLDPDEGRYAEIPREMLESGDFITPHLNYVKYFEKPPLFYWLVAGAMALFGQHEWVLRAVSGMAGFLTVLLVIGLGRRILGGRTGVTAGWIYLTSLVPLILARMPIIDGVFSLFLTATWGAWWLGYVTPGRPRARSWYSVAWGCMGLATMTKGIAAIVLTALIVFGFIAIRRDWAAFRSLAWYPGPLLFVLIVLPWHVIVTLRNPEFFHFYFVVQHFGRLAGLEHAKPFWFFPLILPFGMLFWTAFFFPAAVNAAGRATKAVRSSLTTPKGGKEGAYGKNKPKGVDGSEPILFLVIWVVAVVGLFSLSRCKLVPYILPAYPAVALLLASYLTGNGLNKPSTRWCSAVTALLLLILIPVATHYAQGQDTLPINELTWPVRAAQAGLLFGSVLMALAALWRRLAPIATGLALLALIPTMIMTVPMVAKHRKIGAFLKAMPRPLPAEIRVAEWRNYDQGLSFYSLRRTILVDNVGELEFGSALGNHKDFFLRGEESLKRLAAEGPLLVNLRPGDWPKVRRWGLFRTVAANRTNVMVGNEGFFRLTGLMPWPDEAVTSPPLLLMPRPLNSPRGEG